MLGISLYESLIETCFFPSPSILSNWNFCFAASNVLSRAILTIFHWDFDLADGGVYVNTRTRYFGIMLLITSGCYCRSLALQEEQVVFIADSIISTSLPKPDREALGSSSLGLFYTSWTKSLFNSFFCISCLTEWATIAINGAILWSLFPLITSLLWIIHATIL